MKIFILLALTLLACNATEPIVPEWRAEALQGVAANCEAQASDTLTEPLSFAQADYEQVAAVCISRKSAGLIDVQGWLLATSSIDVQATIAVSGLEVEIVVPGAQTPLGYARQTTLLGSIYVPAGDYAIALQVATGAPDASVIVLPGTWLMATARQDLLIP